MKAEQKLAIRSFASGNDVMTCLPTGYGKSYCFAILLHIYDCIRRKNGTSSIVSCVEPLKSLLLDQKGRFGMAAAFVRGLDGDQQMLGGTRKGKYHLVYIS